MEGYVPTRRASKLMDRPRRPRFRRLPSAGACPAVITKGRPRAPGSFVAECRGAFAASVEMGSAGTDGANLSRDQGRSDPVAPARSWTASPSHDGPRRGGAFDAVL